MRAAIAGDPSSYRHLLEELTPVLRAAARRGLKSAGADGTDAEDIVQDALLAIHLKRQSWDQDLPIGPWLRAVVRHKMVDALRRRGRRAEVAIDDLAELLPASDTEPSMIVFDVGRHLDSLPKSQRNAVRAIAVEGASVGETALRLKMTEGAVRVALHRGLAALASMFNREGT